MSTTVIPAGEIEPGLVSLSYRGQLWNCGVAVFGDPFPLLCGAGAAAVARSVMLPLFHGGAKGNGAAVKHRMWFLGVLMWMYVPAHKRLEFDALNDDTTARALRYAVAAGGTAWTARVLTTPLFKAQAAASLHQMPLKDAFKYLFRSARGGTALWSNEHPLIPNTLYHILLLMGFEAARRSAEVRGFPCGPEAFPPAQVAVHAACGTAAAAVASAVTYPMARKSYYLSLVRPSVVTTSLAHTMLKEVPMMGVFFGTFTGLMQLAAPHHERYGFGY